jgi:AP2 domain
LTCSASSANSSQQFSCELEQSQPQGMAVQQIHGGSPMQTIPLTQGKLAIVDDEDYPHVSKFKWCYRGNKDGTQGYAVRHHKVDGKFPLLYLHRHLMPPGKDQETIFRNHDRLDCRRENLLVVSHEESKQHNRVRRDSKSGIKGVSHNPETNTWTALVYRHGHCYTIGTYGSPEAAKAAYEGALKKENPDLHKPPMAVERANNSESVERENSPSLST